MNYANGLSQFRVESVCLSWYQSCSMRFDSRGYGVKSSIRSNGYLDKFSYLSGTLLIPRLKSRFTLIPNAECASRVSSLDLKFLIDLFFWDVSSKSHCQRCRFAGYATQQQQKDIHSAVSIKFMSICMSEIHHWDIKRDRRLHTKIEHKAPAIIFKCLQKKTAPRLKTDNPFFALVCFSPFLHFLFAIRCSQPNSHACSQRQRDTRNMSKNTRKRYSIVNFSYNNIYFIAPFGIEMINRKTHIIIDFIKKS